MTANVRRAVMGQQDAIARELRMCEGLLHSLGTAVARGVHSPSPSRAERKLECPGAPMRKKSRTAVFTNVTMRSLQWVDEAEGDEQGKVPGDDEEEGEGEDEREGGSEHEADKEEGEQQVEGEQAGVAQKAVG